MAPEPTKIRPGWTQLFRVGPVVEVCIAPSSEQKPQQHRDGHEGKSKNQCSREYLPLRSTLDLYNSGELNAIFNV